ncbi:MAG TPA: FAD-dependent oxidoreductase [Pseudonocardiaceae bacterium]|nr:FAD-dependent oxidoreductase [Pseudonocardiaceae bacterium]
MSEDHMDRAVVLGAGMAGLLAARVLADHFSDVVLIDRDRVIGVSDARRGVPQGRHAHGLLAKGQQILEQLFPGFTANLAADGVLIGDLTGDIRWYFNGRKLAQAPSGLLSVAASRPELESRVRARVAALPNVRFLAETVVQSLVTTPDNRKVIGVRVAGDTTEVIDARLVVDATGRGSRATTWLTELGYARPTEDRLDIDLAYVSRFFRLRSDPWGTDISINSVASPVNPRGGFLGRFPDDLALLSLTGIGGNHPPRDHEGFLDYAKHLAAPEIHAAVRDAEPLGDIAGFKIPASVYRRFDQLDRFPDGFVVVGDGVCGFDPVYGQGMTVAAQEAVALDEHLKNGPLNPLRFFQEIVPVIAVPWEIGVGGDLVFPGVRGRELTRKDKIGGALIGKIHTAAAQDPEFTKAFFRVAGLVDPPTALMKPGLLLKAVRTSAKVQKTRSGLVGERAVVIGGSMAGTLAARVLHENYRDVVVVDRDKVLGVREPRKGAPHTAHAHALLAKGQLILSELFPGLLPDLVGAGVPLGDLGEMHWFFNGRLAKPAHTGLTSITVKRPFLENYLRTRVAAVPNVEYREHTHLVRLLSSTDGRITGVRLRGPDDVEYDLAADLVVDAGGRGSRLPALLAELGYQRPPEDKMHIGLAYTSRLYKTTPEMFGDIQSFNVIVSPEHPRGTFFGKVADGECIMSLVGMFGDHPPADHEGFLLFAKSLPVPHIYEAAVDAEPLTDPVTFNFPASVRRRYEKLDRFPDGLVVLGDAICSFDPVYGQGISVTALQAMALRDQLRRHGDPQPKRYLKAAAHIIDFPWQTATSGDYNFPQVPGKRPLAVRMGNAYMAKLLAAAEYDSSITRTFMRIAGLVDSPAGMMSPGFVAKVLRGAKRAAGK